MSLKETIAAITQKIRQERDISENFLRDPVKTLESLLGIELPVEETKELLEEIKKAFSLRADLFDLLKRLL